MKWQEKKIIIIAFFIFFALPIPISLLSWFSTLMYLSYMININWFDFDELITGLVSLIAMLLAGTYLVTYIFSIDYTRKAKKIINLSFLPLLHIILFIVFFMCSKLLEPVY